MSSNWMKNPYPEFGVLLINRLLRSGTEKIENHDPNINVWSLQDGTYRAWPFAHLLPLAFGTERNGTEFKQTRCVVIAGFC